jgi:hypothetical protein
VRVRLYRVRILLMRGPILVTPHCEFRIARTRFAKAGTIPQTRAWAATWVLDERARTSWHSNNQLKLSEIIVRSGQFSESVASRRSTFVAISIDYHNSVTPNSCFRTRNVTIQQSRPFQHQTNNPKRLAAAHQPVYYLLGRDPKTLALIASFV